MKPNRADVAAMERLLTTFAQAVRRLRVLQLLPLKQRGTDHREQLAQAAAEVDDLTNLHLLGVDDPEQEQLAPGVTDIAALDQRSDSLVFVALRS